MERLAALLANDISPQGVESDEGGAPPQTLPSSQSIVAAPYLLLSSLSSIIWSTTDAAAPRLAAGASAASVLALNRAPASAGNVGDPVNAKPRALSTARSRITSALRRIKRKAPGGGRAQDSQGKKQKKPLTKASKAKAAEAAATTAKENRAKATKAKANKRGRRQLDRNQAGGGEEPAESDNERQNEENQKKQDTRQRVVAALTAALTAQPAPSQPSQPSVSDIGALATAVEAAALARFPATAAAYRALCRSLCHNLKQKDNQALRGKVLSGAIAPAALVRMDKDQLASEAMQQARQQRAAENMARMVRIEATGTSTSKYRCPVCENNDCYYFDHSTRNTSTKSEIWGSKDEEHMSTALIKCKTCHHSWKVSGGCY